MVRARTLTPLLAGFGLCLAGCGERQQRSNDTGEVSECADGYLADRGRCVPEHCGAGTWGSLEVDAATVYVDIEAEDGGDGSSDAPLRSIHAAADLAGSRGGGLVAVAAGSYPETLTLTSDHASVHLAGRCRELVTLDASVGDEATPGIDVGANHGEVGVSGLTVVGSSFLGVRLSSGTLRVVDSAVEGSGYIGVGAFRGSLAAPSSLELVGCDVSGNGITGIVAYQSGVEVSLVDTVVRDTFPDESGEYGYGIQVFSGAALSAERCVVAGNTRVGISVLEPGTEVSLVDTAVRDTRTDANGDYGHGVEALQGATLSARGCEVSGSAAEGIGASGDGTVVTLVDTVVRGTVSGSTIEFGYGVMAGSGAKLSARGCEIVENTSAGVLAINQGAQVTLVDTVVRDTRPSLDGYGGLGVEVTAGAAIQVLGCEVSGNRDVGLGVRGTGSRLSIMDTVVRDTRPNEHGQSGDGIAAADGAQLGVDGCEVLDNAAAGILVAGAGTQAVIRDSIVSGTATDSDAELGMLATGLAAQQGAYVAATGLVVRENEGVGLSAGSPDTYLSCSGCQLRGNQFAAALVVDGGTLELLHSEIAGTSENVNLGGGVGIWAAEQAPWAPPALLVSDCTITDNLAAGAWLAGGGSYRLEDNRISGSAALPHGATTRCGDGVFAAAVEAWDDVDGLLLSGNTVADNQGSGLFLDDAHALLSDNTWTGNPSDLWLQGDACMSPRAEYAEVPTHEICPEWDRPACDLFYGLGLTLAEVEPARAWISSPAPDTPPPAAPAAAARCSARPWSPG